MDLIVIVKGRKVSPTLKLETAVLTVNRYYDGITHSMALEIAIENIGKIQLQRDELIRLRDSITKFLEKY